MKTLHTIYTNFAKRLALVLTLLLTLGVTTAWAAVYTYDCTSNKNFYTDAGLTTNPSTGNSNTFAENASFYAEDGACFTVLRASKVYFNSGYLMVENYQPVLQLPTYANEKITKVKFWNSSGCSTSVKVTIKSGSNTAAAQQTWSNKGSSYTYNISETYQSSTLKLDVTSANAQITKIEITTSATCANSVAVSAGTNTNVNSISFSPGSIATCSSTETDRQVTITVTPNTGYEMTSGARLTFTKTSGTATATYVSGPTGSGPYTFVYRFNQNDNGAGTFSAICTAKQYTITLNNQSATTAGTTSVTATYNANTNLTTAITTPTKTGYTFGGYYTSTNGSGTQLIDADGNFIAKAGGGSTYTDADKIWKYANNITLYAKWTARALTNYRTSCSYTCTDQYTFDYGGVKLCFSQVDESNEYQITDFTIPETTTNYWVGYNGYFYDSNLGTSGAKSANNQFKYLPIAYLQHSNCEESGYQGESYQYAMQGAYGKLRIYDNYPNDNLFVGFIPAGYQMRYGTGENWANFQLFGNDKVWTSEVMDITAELVAKYYYINIYSGATFNANDAGVAINHWTDGSSLISSMQRKTNNGDNWANGVSAGMRGFFRTWVDNCYANGYCHFVPTHRIVYVANWPAGATGVAPSDSYSEDVSVEESKEITLQAAPTAPAGYIFSGWYDAPSGGNLISTSYTISAGATADVTLYAQWKQIASLSWSAPTCTVTIASESNVFPTLTATPEAIKSGIKYSSSDPAVATIDANGNIILKSAGTTTIKAYYEEDGTYAAAEAAYELTVEVSTNCRWEEVTIDDIEYGDEVVVVMAHGLDLYALPYDKETATNSNPLAIKITLDDFKSTINNTCIWYITKEDEGSSFTLSPKTATDKYLTCNSSSNAVRINTASERNFTIENGFLKNIYYSTFLAISTNAAQKDWRHYASTNTTISSRAQTLKFYKRVCLPEGQYWVKWMVNGQEYTVGNPTTMVVAGGQVVKLPTIPDDYQLPGCTSKKFIGWTTDEILVETDDAPTMFTDAASSPPINTNQTFHALFADVEEGEEGWAQVTTTDDLIAGDIYTIGSSSTVGNGKVLGAQQSNNRAAVSWNSGNLVELTLGGSTSAWTLSDGTGYLCAASSSSNHLKTQEMNDANGTWSINFSTTTPKGSAIIIAQGNYTRNVLRYNVNSGNGGNPLFSCYKDSEQMAAIYLFKKLPGTIFSGYVTQCCTPWEAPTLSATTSIAVGDNTTITPNSGTTYGNVTYSSSDEKIATVDANGKVTGVKPGKVTITATWDGVDGVNNYCPAETTIDITVRGSFTITYDANHASATGSTTATTIAYPTGQGTVATNGFALAEHQFVKWNTYADGSGTSYSEGASITLTDDITLYAIWQRYCTITYVIPAGGGTLAAGATATVVAGGAVQMPGIENNSIDLEYSCEKLIGWTTNSATHEAAGLKPDPFYAIGASLSGITQNTTLYAVYSRAGNGLGGTVTLTEEEMYGWEDASYGTQRDLTTCVGTWTTTGYKSGSHAIQLRSDDSPYVKFPDLSGNITQVVLNATKGTTTTTLTEGTFTLKTEGGTTIASASVNGSGICTISVTGSYTTAYLYSSAIARITNIAITYGPPAIISTTLDCSSDVDECTITYDLNESFLAAGTQILGSCHNSTFKFSEVGTYTICSEPQANEYKLIGWNNQCDGKGSLTYTPGQEITSLPQNIITLYAQWAPEVIVHDSYEETKVYPTAMGGSITLNSGQYACDPKKYDFIGWTTDDPQLWQQNTTPPALLTDNGDGTVTFTPEEPSQVYAVYAIEDLANSDAFKLSSIVDGTKYYVGFNEDRNGRVKTVSTEAEALTFYKEETTGDDNYLISYIIPATAYNDPGTKQYLYYYEVGSTKRLQITTNPDVNQGWTLEPDGDGYKFRSIQYNSVYLSMTSGNVQTNGTGNVFNMETVAEYKYIAKTNCSENVTITFVPGNGTMTPSTNPVTAKTGDIITLPTCTYEGWTFLGWVTENIELTELEIDPSRLYTETYEVGNSDVTLYAYYTQTPTPADFDGTTSGTWKMYTEVSTDVYKYALSHGSSRPDLMSSTEYCPNATEWTFTNTGEANVYYIQDEDNLYLAPGESYGIEHFIFTSTPFTWKVIEVDATNTYRIYRYDTRSDSYERLIMSNQSGLFYHSAKINEKNSNWYHVTIGGCTNPVYTTDPQPSKIISLVGSPMITSTIGQTVKASQKLQLVIKDMDANADVTIAADGLTFYDTDNNVVNTLQTGPNGSLTATFTVAYTPSVADNQIVKPTITITCGSTVRTFYNVSCRSLPETFVIAAKTGNAWVALTANIQRSGTQEAELIQVDNITTPTKATITPNTTKYQLFGLQNNLPSQANSRYKNNGTAVHLYSTNQSEVISASTSPDTKTYINADATRDNAAGSANALFYEWQLTTNDLVHYNIVNSNTQNTSNTKLGYSATYAQWGMYQTGNNVIQEVLLLPIEKDITEMDVEVMEWGTNSMALRFGSEAPATVDITLGATTTKGLSLANLNSGNTSDIYKVEGLSLAGNDCEALLITDATDASKGKLIRKPILVSGDKKGSDYTSAPTRDVCMHSDIVILNGGKLTADEAKTVGSHVDFANIYVYPGGKLVLDGNSLGVKRQVYLRGGYSWLNSTYALPEVYVNGDINFNGSGNMIYDYYIQNQKYYQFALPYDVQLTNVTDESGADDFPVWVKHYNGALRAEDAYATSWEWYPSEEGDANAYFEAGIGYIIAAKPRQVGNVANRPLSIIRFPLGNSAFTGGEGDKSVVTTAHGIDGYNAGTVTANNVGWNFIGNPFMATWKGDIGHKKLAKHPDEDNWDGSYHWVDSNVKFITIMSPEDGSDYEQTIAADADLNPFFPFYLQETAEGGSGEIDFSSANRIKKAPAMLLTEQPRETYVQIEITTDDATDQTGMFIGNQYSDNIDFDDYEKMFGTSTDKPKVWLVHDNTRLAFEAMTENRATGMTPLGYRAPQDGEYMLVLNDEVSQLNNVESIYLTDYKTGVTDYDLTLSTYEFESTTTLYNDTRFAIRVVMRDNTQGSVTAVDNVGTGDEQIHKFIYQDKIYILHHGVIYDATGKRVITINK